MSRVVFFVFLTQSLCHVSDAQIASSVPIGDMKRTGNLGTVPDMDDVAMEMLSSVEDDGLDESSKEALAMGEDSEMEAVALKERSDQADLNSGEDVEENEGTSPWSNLVGKPARQS